MKYKYIKSALFLYSINKMSTRSHRNIMKHEHVLTQIVQTKTPRTISKLFPQDRNSKLKWNVLCTLLCIISLILECINVTTVSLLKTIPKMLPMHSEIDIPKAWPSSSGNIQT